MIDKSEDQQENVSLQHLPMENIVPNRYQPRTEFDRDRIRELADSIEEHGLLQPITVRPIEEGMYEIIAGERRFRALKMLNREEAEVIVKYLTDTESAAIALIENIQRENLSSIEEAKAYKKLLKMDGITQKNLAQNLGKSQSFIANKLRLLKLSDEVIEALQKQEITERHARSLLSLEDEMQGEVLDEIRREKMTVKDTEHAVKKKLKHTNDALDFNDDVSFVLNDLNREVDKLKNKGFNVSYEASDEKAFHEVTIKIYK
nr:ParB/RepB/Spo0J family partition protein [Salinicoccus sp. ID82-1]